VDSGAHTGTARRGGWVRMAGLAPRPRPRPRAAGTGGRAGTHVMSCGGQDGTGRDGMGNEDIKGGRAFVDRDVCFFGLVSR